VTRGQLTSAVFSSALATLGAVLCLFALVGLQPMAAPPPGVDVLDQGWHAEDVPLAADTVAQMPPFQIVGAVEDNSRRNVRLWEAALKVNGGKHLSNTAQQVGDCVSWGVRNAVDYLACQQIAQGENETLRRCFAPWVYGLSRVTIGQGRIRGDGSVGAWGAEAVRRYGVLAEDEPGVPPYSGQVAREWGQRPGPPEPLFLKAVEFKVQSVALVTTPEEARDAICNGYPITIASSWGTRTIRPRDGRQVAEGDASWAHQMCLIAYDGSASEPYYYVLNSWGPNAHPQPLQGEPPGGFWIRERDVARICSAGDSFAFSDFDGFPSRQLDFSVIGQAAAGAPQPFAAQGVPTVFNLTDDFQMPLLLVGAALCCAGLVGLGRLWGNFARGVATAAALAALMLTVSLQPAAAQQATRPAAVGSGGAANRGSTPATTPTAPASRPSSRSVSATATATSEPAKVLSFAAVSDPVAVTVATAPRLCVDGLRFGCVSEPEQTSAVLCFCKVSEPEPSEPTADKPQRPWRQEPLRGHVWIYGLESCAPCHNWRDQIKHGDDELRVHWAIYPDDDLPADIREKIAQHGDLVPLTFRWTKNKEQAWSTGVVKDWKEFKRLCLQ
jgi:hypothetical protein